MCLVALSRQDGESGIIYLDYGEGEENFLILRSPKDDSFFFKVYKRSLGKDSPWTWLQQVETT